MNYLALLSSTQSKLLKAIGHLEYSYKKIQLLPDDLSQMDDETMETWESFSSRLARVSDIFVARYLRTYLAIEEPGYKGSTKDVLNKAEKLGLIGSAQDWVIIRELRNVTAHEYNEEDMSAFYQKLKSLCPIVLDIKNHLLDQ